MKKINNKLMKTNKILAFFMMAATTIAVTSCVQDDDFNIPNSIGAEENAALNNIMDGIANGDYQETTIAAVKNLFVEDEATEVVSDLIVKGYVTSSDASGNFYKEFFIQDAPENPTAAIKIVLNQVDSYNQFNIGREIYIKLKGLFVGETRSGDGVIAIGGARNIDNEVESITENSVPSTIFRSTVTETIVPLSLGFGEISDANIGMLVQVANAEFISSLNGSAFTEATDDFDTQRLMQSCEGFDYTNFILETSSFANFKQQLLPTGGGTITAVVNKTFNGSDLVLVLNSVEDIDMTGERCSLLNIEDFTVILEEDFESMPTNTTISSNDWSAYAEEGSYNWRVLTTNDSGNPGPGNNIASMGAYNSGTPVNIAWLISPQINFDTYSSELMTFISSNSFSDDSELELLISTDWDGTEANITSATWTPLSGNIVSDSEYYQDWVTSGSVDLSSYTGMGYVAFKYIGGDNSGNNPPNTSTTDGTFEIDNITVLGL